MCLKYQWVDVVFSKPVAINYYFVLVFFWDARFVACVFINEVPLSPSEALGFQSGNDHLPDSEYRRFEGYRYLVDFGVDEFRVETSPCYKDDT